MGSFALRRVIHAVGASLLVAGLGLEAARAAPVELRVFEWEDYIRPHAEGFEAYARTRGVDVRLSYLTGPDGKEIFISSADDIFQAVRADKVDVVTPTNNYYKDSGAKLLKTLAPIDLAQVPNFADLVGNLKSASYAEDDGKKYAIPLLGGGYSLAYNADRVAEPPKSWAILADPKAKGRVSITDSQYEANVYVAAILAGTAPEKIYVLDNLDSAKVTGILEKMTANARAFWDTNPSVALMEKDLDYIADYGFGVAFANAKGQNWKFAGPAEPTTVWLDNLSLTPAALASPEKAKAAHLLLDYMISPAVQAKMAADYGVVVPNPKAIELVPSDKRAAIRVGTNEFYRETLLWQPLDKRTRNGFKLMWDHAVDKARAK